MSKDQDIKESQESISVVQRGINSFLGLFLSVKDVERGVQGGNPFKAYNSKNLASRIYIEDNLESEKVLLKVLNMLQGLYASSVLALLDESKHINKLETVSERMSNISPDFSHLNFVSTLKNLYEYVETTEAMNTRRNNNSNNRNNNQDDNKNKGRGSNAANNNIDAKELPPLVRKLIVNLSDGSGDNNSDIEVALFISLYPTFMSQNDLLTIMGTGSSNNVWERYIMYKAGEIRFLRDFLFNLDIFQKKRRNYLKSVESEYQRQYYDNIDSKRIKSIEKTYKNIRSGRPASMVNVANSIILISMNTKNLLRTEASLDLDNTRQRNELYKETMSMIFVVMDSRYNKVDIYINGVNDKITFNYDQINFRFDSKSDILKILDNIKSLRDDSTISF